MGFDDPAPSAMLGCMARHDPQVWFITGLSASSDADGVPDYAETDVGRQMLQIRAGSRR
jgi:hypothetical protein